MDEGFIKETIMMQPFRIAILMTVYNRKEKTIRCLDSVCRTLIPHEGTIIAAIFLTDDGCKDGTADAIREKDYPLEISILQGDGSLFWNGGMINSWKAALAVGGWDGYLWLNDDIEVLPEFWSDLLQADAESVKKYGKQGIYVGSTKDADTGKFTYGGFVYTNKLTLLDKFIHPDGESCQECEAAHGNITFVSSAVVQQMGIFCDDYIHGGSDHDYTYRAHKAGFPILVLPHFSAICRNDHTRFGGRSYYFKLPLRQRLKLANSPKGLNLHNALLFSKRCFPFRYPLILITGFFKVLFPRAYYYVYLRMRGFKTMPPMEEILKG